MDGHPQYTASSSDARRSTSARGNSDSRAGARVCAARSMPARASSCWPRWPSAPPCCRKAYTAQARRPRPAGPGRRRRRHGCARRCGSRGRERGKRASSLVECTLTVPALSLHLPVNACCDDQALKRSVCKFSGPAPGQAGNYVIVGHNYLSGARIRTA